MNLPAFHRVEVGFAVRVPRLLLAARARTAFSTIKEDCRFPRLVRSWNNGAGDLEDFEGEGIGSSHLEGDCVDKLSVGATLCGDDLPIAAGVEEISELADFRGDDLADLEGDEEFSELADFRGDDNELASLITSAFAIAICLEVDLICFTLILTSAKTLHSLSLAAAFIFVTSQLSIMSAFFGVLGSR